jgi:biopolymer transport protein ExbD
VILIIFIVTASFVFRNTMDMQLPQSASAEQRTSGLLNLALTADGELLIDGQPAAEGDIAAAVRSAREKLGQEGAGGEVSAFVSADVATQYGRFARVVDRLRLAGVADIALDTQPLDLDEVR